MRSCYELEPRINIASNLISEFAPGKNMSWIFHIFSTKYIVNVFVWLDCTSSFCKLTFVGSICHNTFHAIVWTLLKAWLDNRFLKAIFFFAFVSLQSVVDIISNASLDLNIPLAAWIHLHESSFSLFKWYDLRIFINSCILYHFLLEHVSSLSPRPNSSTQWPIFHITDLLHFLNL